MTIGVYRIISKIDGRFYIGSSNNCERRFKEHRSDLTLKKHHSPALQNAYNKYGPDAFRFEIIVSCFSWDAALDIEQEMLNEWHRNRQCMNGSAKARTPILDPAVRAKARASANKSEKYKESHRRVCVERNADPEFQKRATAGVRASAKHKAAVTNNALKLQRPEIVAKNRAALSVSVAQKAAARKQTLRFNTDPVPLAKFYARWTGVIGTSLKDGSVIRFRNQSEAARAVGCSSSGICECCTGKQKFAKGYTWRKERPSERGPQ